MTDEPLPIKDLVSLLRNGSAADSAETFAVLDDRLAPVRQFWQPNRTSYAGLANMYVENSAERERLDAQHPGLAEFIRIAMKAYAESRLT